MIQNMDPSFEMFIDNIEVNSFLCQRFSPISDDNKLVRSVHRRIKLNILV